MVLLESLPRWWPAVQGFAFPKSCSLDRLAEAAIVNLVAHFDAMVQGQGRFHQESLRDRHSFNLFVAISMLWREACDGFAIVFPTVVVF